MNILRVLLCAAVFAQAILGCTKLKKRPAQSGANEVETTVGAALDKQIENLTKNNLSGSVVSSGVGVSGGNRDQGLLGAKYSYLAYFSRPENALAHSKEVMALGAEVSTYAEGRLLKITGDKRALDEVAIPVSTPITLNLPVRWTIPAQKFEGSNRFSRNEKASASSKGPHLSTEKKSLQSLFGANTGSSVEVRDRVNKNGATGESTENKFTENKFNETEVLIESLWTARKITGVEKLLERFPQADGHGLKVAVFDTGIDFGVEGVFQASDRTQKLIGFYDLVGYGKTGTRAIEKVEEKEGFRQAAWTDETSNPLQVVLDPSISSSLIPVRAGILDEAKASRSYLSSNIDINDNEVFVDQFLFLVLKSETGELKIAVDVDLNNSLDSTELLGDFNSTFSYIDTRKDVAPSGARPLAVTITSENEVQFHSVPGGHGTSCGMIIAGDGYANGRLRGLAPKAKLISYTLDVQGQDVYSVDQLLEMFLHAKTQGVDAISISWGFATADLISARFVAEFIEKEIGDAGILVAIAAGNEGPGTLSAAADDYIPRNGFGIGAIITPEQARNVYRWTGSNQEAVIFYSSRGPTRGGRPMPDLASPLMTWVRGQRATSGPQFEGFGGTSSATPAFVGSAMALVSALKDAGYLKIDQRILKLALQRSARNVGTSEADALAQGAGLVQVDKAYDWYVQLFEEQKRAELDKAKRTPFAYELKPKVLLRNFSEAALEGIVLDEPTTQVEVQVQLSTATQKLIDPLVTVEPVLIRHKEKWLKTPEILPIQTSNNKFVVSIDPSVFKQGQIYSDTIELIRPVDQVVLARVPVLIRIPAHRSAPMGGANSGALSGAKTGAVLATFQQVLNPEDFLRFAVELREPSSLVVEGLLREVTSGFGSRLGFQIYNGEGVKISDERVIHAKAWENIRYQSAYLLPGKYEVAIYRAFARPASLGIVDFTGVLRTQAIRIAGQRPLPENHLVSLEALDDLDFDKSRIHFNGIRMQTVANRTPIGRFLGEIVANDLAPIKDFKINLVQDEFDRITQNLLHAEVVLIDKATDEVVYRGWVNQQAKGSGAGSEVSLAKASKHLQVLIYPNIIKWPSFLTEQLTVEVEVPFAQSIDSDWLESATPLREGESRTFQYFPQQNEAFPTVGAIGAGSSVFGTIIFKKGDTTSEIIRF